MELFAEFLKVSRAVRRLGSAAIDLCYVAAGRLDGFWEQSLQPWDVAAGALIVQEAGGRVTDLAGGPYSSRAGNLIASNGHIHDAMVEIVESYFNRKSGVTEWRRERSTRCAAPSGGRSDHPVRQFARQIRPNSTAFTSSPWHCSC